MDAEYIDAMNSLIDLNTDDGDIGTGPTVSNDDNKYFNTYNKLLEESPNITCAGFRNRNFQPLSYFTMVILDDLSKNTQQYLYVGAGGYQGIIVIYKYLFNRGFRLHDLTFEDQQYTPDIFVNDVVALLTFDLQTYQITLGLPQIMANPDLVQYLNLCIQYSSELITLFNERWVAEENAMQSGEELPSYDELTYAQLVNPGVPVLVPQVDPGSDRQVNQGGGRTRKRRRKRISKQTRIRRRRR